MHLKLLKTKKQSGSGAKVHLKLLETKKQSGSGAKVHLKLLETKKQSGSGAKVHSICRNSFEIAKASYSGVHFGT